MKKLFLAVLLLCCAAPALAAPVGLLDWRARASASVGVEGKLQDQATGPVKLRPFGGIYAGYGLTKHVGLTASVRYDLQQLIDETGDQKPEATLGVRFRFLTPSQAGN